MKKSKHQTDGKQWNQYFIGYSKTFESVTNLWKQKNTIQYSDLGSEKLNNDNELKLENVNDDENQFKSENVVDDGNVKPTKIPYPKYILFIIGNEFCERFNFYGMRSKRWFIIIFFAIINEFSVNFFLAILFRYLIDKLGLDVDTSTAYVHIFAMVTYFTCIFGGILSDVCLGKFTTILILSIVYVIGSTTISIGAIPSLNVMAGTAAAGLTFIALGSGGIKPCVSAFGGDQFKLPEQTKQMESFFSLFYFAINAGSLLSTIITPTIRSNVHCFGDDDCYSLAFAVPAMLMAISIGKFCYHRERKIERKLTLLSF